HPHVVSQRWRASSTIACGQKIKFAGRRLQIACTKSLFDERRNIDLVHFVERVLAVIKTHAHDDPLGPPVASASLTRRPIAGSPGARSRGAAAVRSKSRLTSRSTSAAASPSLAR